MYIFIPSNQQSSKDKLGILVVESLGIGDENPAYYDHLSNRYWYKSYSALWLSLQIERNFQTKVCTIVNSPWEVSWLWTCFESLHLKDFDENDKKIEIKHSYVRNNNIRCILKYKENGCELNCELSRWEN